MTCRRFIVVCAPVRASILGLSMVAIAHRSVWHKGVHGFNRSCVVITFDKIHSYSTPPLILLDTVEVIITSTLFLMYWHCRCSEEHPVEKHHVMCLRNLL
jgi:hypothetical protein